MAEPTSGVPKSDAHGTNADGTNTQRTNTQRTIEQRNDAQKMLMLCCRLVIPIGVAVLVSARFMLPSEVAHTLLGFWLYLFPALCIVVFVISASFCRSANNVPWLLIFACCSFIAAVINLVMFQILFFYHNLGPM